jgi:hypothetical protein
MTYTTEQLTIMLKEAIRLIQATGTPSGARCSIRFKDTTYEYGGGYYFAIGQSPPPVEDEADDDDDIFYYVESIEELFQLMLQDTVQDFVITSIDDWEID